LEFISETRCDKIKLVAELFIGIHKDVDFIGYSATE